MLPLHVLQSEDPGVLFVMEGIFSFNLGIPLNYLLKCFGGKVLVIQVWLTSIHFFNRHTVPAHYFP